MSVEKFKKLHQMPEPLVIGNVWDVISTNKATDAGCKAVGTSSHVIANMLGYEDGENIPFKIMLMVITRIAEKAKILVSADLEAGYSNNYNEIVLNIESLIQAGVVGINLEDSFVKDGKRHLMPSEKAAEKIAYIKKELKLKGLDIFLNARIDTYTTKHENTIEETLTRIKKYEAAGADGIFVPLIEKETDIKKVVESTDLPLNIFLTPKLLNYEKLVKLGVKRISSGDKIFVKNMEYLKENYMKLEKDKNFEFLF
nr:isocitrate lyase/phosphoenolpyruvate mutase family protein [uncultured Flavobacterium sp.]